MRVERGGPDWVPCRPLSMTSASAILFVRRVPLGVSVLHMNAIPHRGRYRVNGWLLNDVLPAFNKRAALSVQL